MKRLHPLAALALSLAACGTNPPPGPGVVDEAPPEILLLTVVPRRAAAGDEISIRFDVSEKTRSVEVQAAGHPTSCTGSTAFTCVYKVYGDEGDGEQPIHVRAVDLAGNVGETDTTFEVDTTGPKITFTRQPGALSNQADGTIEFSADEPAAFGCEVDQAGEKPCSSPLSYSDLAEGQHQIKVSATDEVGNRGTATLTFGVDLTPPETAIDPLPPPVTRHDTVQIAFRATEEASFACRLDQEAFAPCSSPASATLLTDGAHRFEVRATDLSGNLEPEPAFAEFALDLTAPATTLEPIVDDGKPDREVRFTASETGCTFLCALDTHPPAPCTSPWALHALAEGSHQVFVQASDAVGNIEAQAASANFLVDLTGPGVTFTKTPPALSLAPTATFEMTTGEAGSTFECNLDLAGFQACVSPASFTVGTGDHSLAVRGSDRYGNQGAPASFQWTVDLSAPFVTITAQPADFTKDRSASVSFEANKTGMTFTCSLDAAAPLACTSPVNYSGLADGAHTVAIVGTDGGGNVSAPAAASWTVDNAAPVTTVSAIAETGKPDRSISFSANETGCTFECAVDSGAFAACTSPASLAGLADGSRTFRVRATDRAGNVESPEASASFVVDTRGPTASILTGPAGTVFVADATFTFQADEAGSTFECRVDTDALAPCTSPKSLTVTTDGGHTFEVRATDKYGNGGAAAQRSWTVDAFPPTVTLTARPADPTELTQAIFSFTSNKANATFQCSLDGGAAASCTSPKSYAGLADGSHHFEVVAVDTASRKSSPAKVDWTVDTKPPTASFGQAPLLLSNQRTVRFTFSASEAGCTFECSLDGTAFAPCVTPEDVPVGEGLHTFEVRAVDAAGNTGPSISYAFETDLTPPLAPAIDQPDPSLTTNTTPTFSWVASATAVSYSFQLSTTEDFGQIVQSQSSGTSLFYAASALPSDRYYFRVNARDAAGNDSPWSKTGILEVRTWGFFNPKPQGATFLRVSCLDAQMCWFVGEAGLAARTTDGGATFRQASTGVSGSLTGLHVFDATTAVACGLGGAILRTTDGGVTWFSISSGVTADLHSVRFSGLIGYAVGEGGTVLRSADGGLTWKRQAAPTSTASLRDLAILDVNATTLVVVGGSGVAYRTQDSGASWTPGVSGTSVLLRAVSFVDANTGYAVGDYSTAGKNMRKTVDGGRTWTEVATGITKELYGVHFVDALKGWTMGDSDGSVASLRYTLDGGTTWLGDGQYPLTVRPSLRAMTFNPATGSGMAVGDGGTVLVTSDSWATYLLASGLTGTLASKTDDQEIRAVRFVSPTVGYLFGNAGFAMKTTDGGETLTPLSPSVIGVRDIHAASFIDASNGFIGGDTTSSFIARTIDGTNFVRQTTPAINVRGLHFVSPTYCIFVGTSAKVVEWKSGVFQAVTLPGTVTASLRAVRMVDESHGFIVGDGGEILVNQGSGWVSEKITGVTNGLSGVWAVDATTAFAVGDGGRLLKRTVMGWSAPSSGTTATLKDIAFADAQNGWIVGDGTILVTSDGGTTWKKQVSPTGSTLWSVSPVSADVLFAVGSARTAIRTALGRR